MSHSTARSTNYNLKAPQALAALTKNFSPVIAQPDGTPVPPPSNDYFERMNINNNIELDSGSKALYDVQPDNRFLVQYIMYNIAQSYPDLNVKGHPMVSPLSLAAYCLIIVNAHLLGCDAFYRPNKSTYASKFFSDAAKNDYFSLLLNCKVPTFLADIIQELSPVYDPRRSNHLFVPTLAAYSHLHDFGRSIPPQVFLAVHHYLATANQRTAPDDQQDHVYELLITTFAQQEFYIANYFGTRFGHVHENWLNTDFEGFFNPVVGRTLVQKPTFGKINIVPQSYTDHQSMDMYEHFLVCDDDNIDKISNFMGSLSVFFETQSTAFHSLGTILATVSGSLLFSHSIEPVTLPTWTGIKPSNNDGTEETHKDFAKAHNFLIDHKPSTGTLAYPSDVSEVFLVLYRLLKQKFSLKDAPNPRVIFTPSVHVSPYILYFQPYDVNASSLALTIIAGLKIETAEFDGFTLPSEHPEDSLDDNNSQYLQSAIRLDTIHTVLAHADPTTNHITLLARRHVDRDSQAIGVAIRDMSRNVIPRFANEAINDTEIENRPNAGFVQEDGHDDPRTAYTYTAAVSGKLNFGQKSKVYLWSSYRVIHKARKPELKDISMVASFRPVYGTNVTLSRSKNPALIIPH
jgi:hypothetical protein